ncbi:4Fe-4S binding protein [Tuwongella immobilis]|uniref:4Fe-4S ferredoxin-type domain-containing protein n=1 Tax=Tuwongella immobilis TaxID=692036 RepID=A0A6C2YHA0_9BACT|nr:4Fe-4S binding protein [Tuwongella immobilis]VIP00621.1 4fe-4s ferredoxin : 4Fe-4S ferredoxin iron-sulfur binding domain-containing protein OS=Calothrix sp. PCC 7507 GN=Cal7507_4321 PE=4 SV=1: Fer4 [Tuwongella immobilis]VTR96660.1 4fe-4s ferredoxin : 4Fe-4S ferredoxin iron-sulfur binding domain-containing protein OS=Calothrix sp. PCC 7507 GN=Cal7507_4321 PE=4 SV=1: Fer4 [Tuwongella immobilis]
MKLEHHPTVLELRRREKGTTPERISAAELREFALRAGADDAGVIGIDRPEIADQRDEILHAFPKTRALVSLVCRMHREPIRSPKRSIANLEFHQSTDHVNEVARTLVQLLETRGIRSLNPPSGFPMEMTEYPGKIWVVSHKPVAVAAGMGQMGIHRNVIHPRFGNFILLGTVLVAAEIDEEQQGRAIDFNPCLGCKLCVAACPVGAIKPDGQFDPSACLTHNYREFMGGFLDFSNHARGKHDASGDADRWADTETASMWQSLSFGANYKAAYCLAVCPAGEEVISPYLDNPKEFRDATLRPLVEKTETIYVVPQSDAETYVQRRFPHKRIQRVPGVRPRTIAGFLRGMSIVFQSGKSAGLDAVYHFQFHGAETAEATVTIRNQRITIESGLIGTPTIRIVADAQTWIGFLRKERSIVWAMIRRKVRVTGSLRWLLAFGKCFPS